MGVPYIVDLRLLGYQLRSLTGLVCNDPPVGFS